MGFSLRPTIVISGIKVANPPWASRDSFLLARRGAVTLDIVELVRGNIEIGDITLEGLDLALERRSDGTGNWELGPAKPANAPEGSAELPNFDGIALRDARLSWTDAQANPIDLTIDSANAVVREDRPLEINSSVVYRQVPIDADLTADRSLQDALAGKPVALSLALRTEAARADLKIDLPKPFDVEGAAVGFAVAGKRLAAAAPASVLSFS